MSLGWQAGAFLFTQDYEQLAINSYAPFVLSPFIHFPVQQTTPDAELDDLGISLYGQGTFTVNERLDLTAGARFDREKREALLLTSSRRRSRPTRSSTPRKPSRTCRRSLPRRSGCSPNTRSMRSVGRGFKAGGFNPASPADSEAFGEEFAWHGEGGREEHRR